MAFHPCPWLPHRHLQTLWPALMPRAAAPGLRWEAWITADGDRVDLGWLGQPKRGTAIVLHGLDGHEGSHYVTPLMTALVRRGWQAVLLCARGTTHHPNHQARSYHSGFTDDLAALAERLHPAGPVAAVGISVGGNQLLRWMGTLGKACPLVAAAAAGVPFDLAAADAALSRGFSRCYQWHLVRGLRAAYQAKAITYDLRGCSWRALRTFRHLDAVLTAPLHGFASVDAYYQAASCRPLIPHITVPTHLIHADDDPFVPPASIPTHLPPSVTLERHRHGGHVGFRHGWRARPWLEERLAEVLTRAADCPGGKNP